MWHTNRILSGPLEVVKKETRVLLQHRALFGYPLNAVCLTASSIFVGMPPVMGVSMNPGRTELQRMP